MTFNDIFKSSFLDQVAGFSFLDMVISLALALAIGLFIFEIYRKTYRGVMYSRSFGITLIALSMITDLAIMTVTSNVVLSLGMVGALSIVRFRTAIKDPMDLVYLFWAISVGIICGAGLAELACIVSFLLTVAIVFLDYLPVSKAAMILVVNTDTFLAEKEILDTVKRFSKHIRVKSRNITNGKLQMLIEVHVKEESELIQAVASMDAVTYTSLVAHDGEVTC